MSVRSMVQVCDRLNADIAGSNTAEFMDVLHLVFVVCCIGSGLCDELITGVLPGVCV